MRHPRLLAWAVALLGVSLSTPLTPAHADSGQGSPLVFAFRGRSPASRSIGRPRPHDWLTGSDNRREAWPLRIEAVSAEILSLKGG